MQFTVLIVSLPLLKTNGASFKDEMSSVAVPTFELYDKHSPIFSQRTSDECSERRTKELVLQHYVEHNNLYVMSVHGDLVGRLAQLRDIASKPELNEAYVLIHAYLPEKDRFSVRTLPFPNGNGGGASFAVRQSSLVLCTPDRFADKYPREREVQVDSSFSKAVRDYPDGTTLNVTSMQYSQVRPLSVVLNKYHRYVGLKTALSTAGVPNPAKKYFGNVHIAPTSDDAILEFEDIHFDECNLLTCTNGRFITFRRCVFCNTTVIVAGKSPFTTLPISSAYVAEGVRERLGTPNVVFENCVFDAGILNEESEGVSVGNAGTVTLLNCVVRNCGVGVITTAGATVTMRHCLIENCMNGIGMGEKTKRFDMQHCLVHKSPQFPCLGGFGILIEPVVSALITGCRIENGQDFGILFSGKSGPVIRATICDCHVSKCRSGVCFMMGAVDATIVSTVLQNNLEYGLCIYPTVIGTVAVNQCTIVGNRMRNVLHFSPAKNMLTVDGVVQAASQSQYPYEVPSQLAAKRCGQRAGICDINCLNCGRKEESGEKFKKCGKCEDVCYCSRECQVAHWKEHKKICVSLRDEDAAAVKKKAGQLLEGTASVDEVREAAAKYKARHN